MAGFKLDTLLKLADVKGTDKKTSLLHFVLEQLLKEENASVDTLSAQLGSIRAAANLQVNPTFKDPDCPPLNISGMFHRKGGKPVLCGRTSASEAEAWLLQSLIMEALQVSSKQRIAELQAGLSKAESEIHVTRSKVSLKP